MTSERPRVQVLTVIWGERYVQEYARLSLPSYLAPGNLPALAAVTDLEFVILTTRESEPYLRAQDAFRRLEGLGPIKVVLIDDLVTSGNYGVTLTLAYARAIISEGERQTDTIFVFMNSDFILADGSFRTLAQRLLQGEGCIMAPSLRATSEHVVPKLESSVDASTGSLVMRPRDLVQLTLDSLHPTVIGKTVTQKLFRCTTHNQLYWQVDGTTMLARYHLIFMLAIKPERPITKVNSYCDYGFVPEMVPSGKFSILAESDEFFMMELQPEAQEAQFVALGASTMHEIARDLSTWTTREHRRFAQHDVVFHSRDIPQSAARVREDVRTFMARLDRLMPNRPVDHKFHFFWHFGVLSWLSLRPRTATAAPPLPAELEWNESRSIGLPSWIPSESVLGRAGRTSFATLRGLAKRLPRAPVWLRPWLIDRLRLDRVRDALMAARSGSDSTYLTFLTFFRRMAGKKPRVPIWRHNWLDGRLLINWIDEVDGQPNARNLLVLPQLGFLPEFTRSLASFEITEIEDFLNRKQTYVRTQRNGLSEIYSNIAIIWPIKFDEKLANTIKTAMMLTNKDTEIAIYIGNNGGELDAQIISGEIFDYSQYIMQKNWLGWRFEVRFAGGIIKRWSQLAESKLAQLMFAGTRGRVLRVPFSVLGLVCMACLTMLNNLRIRRGFANYPDYCTSALFQVSRLGTSPASSSPCTASSEDP